MINVDEMPAGKEMDILIAERVMGWKRLSGRLWHDANGNEQWIDDDVSFVHQPCWSPSTDIAAAWELVEALQHLDFIVRLWSPNRQGRPHISAKTWEASTWKTMSTTTGDLYDFSREPFENSYELSFWGRAADPCLAICRAALKVILSEAK